LNFGHSSPTKSRGILVIVRKEVIKCHYLFNYAPFTGRSFADNRRFAKIARGSLFEVKQWLRRAYKRKLLSETEVHSLQKMIEELTPKLSAYIKSIGNNQKSGK